MEWRHIRGVPTIDSHCCSPRGYIGGQKLLANAGTWKASPVTDCIDGCTKVDGGNEKVSLKNSPATVILVRLLSLSPSERLAREK